MRTVVMGAAVLVYAAALALAAGGVPALAAPGEAEASARAVGQALGKKIEQAIYAEGSFFTPEEQAVVRSKCGYSAGEWDGLKINVNNGVFRCENGKTVDDPEMKAVIAAIEPRVKARVEKVMASAEVKAEMARFAKIAEAAEAAKVAEKAEAAAEKK